MDILDQDKSIQTRVFKALNEAKEKLKAVEAKQSEPIAVVGLGCRFGKNISTPQAFWSFLSSGGDTLREIPGERWNMSDFYDSDPGKPGKIYVSQGGFIDDVSMFDPQFFGIAPREALHMDPQQRLLLEVAYEALEDAAMAAPTARIGKTGVFIGITNNDYARLIAPGGDYSTVGAYHISGNHLNAAAGRISYLLNLNGPSLAVDTACSSSLVAVHLACRSLRTQECRQALVGGVNLILTPEVPIALCKNQMLAADGRCKTFDQSADGFGIGEGCGVVVLKRLSDALEDGDRIWALIRGTAVNNDGASGGFTVPNGPVQTDLIREALNEARLSGDAIDYVEAHGTGTALGDPIEIKAIADALCVNRSKSQPLLVGSVKTNLGHLAAAAGISGLIKTVLSIYHSSIPAHLNFQKPNPHISWDSLPLNVVTQTRPWAATGKMKAAGVSSFGASGTNAHVILSEPPQAQSATGTTFPVLITLSAKDEERLRLLAARFVDDLDSRDLNLTDLAFSLNTGRFHHKHRLSLLVSNSTSFQEQLHAFASGNNRESNILYKEVQANPKIAFFCNDETIFPGMGKQLFTGEPVFHDAFIRCDRLFQTYLNFSIEDLLYKNHDIDTQHLHDSLYVQPALFAVQYALCELWKSWGIRPSAILGCGVGEYLAAQQAGVFSLEDAVKLVASRTRMSQQTGVDRFVESILLPFEKVAEQISYSVPQLTLISNLDGVASHQIQNAAYWVQQQHQPVNVAKGIATLHQMGYQIFIEIGTQPKPSDIARRLPASEILWLCSLAKDCSDDRQVQTILAELYVRGANINWKEFHRSRPGQKISLPTSPFIRKRYWVPIHDRQNSTAISKSHNYHSGHPLLGERLPSPLSSIQYQARISHKNPAFLAEHQVFDKPIFPGAAFIEMALAAAEGKAVVLEKIEFHKALVLREEDDVLQLVIEGGNKESFQIYNQAENNWDLLVSGELEKLKSIDSVYKNIEQLEVNCPLQLEINSFYQKYQQSGVSYGTNFQLIQKIQYGENSALAQIKLTERLQANYHFHPAMLDACFQAIAAILFQQESSVTYVPIRIAKFQFFRSPGDSVISSVRVHKNSANHIISALEIYSEQGELLVSITGFQLKPVQRQEIIPHEIQPQSYLEKWISLSPLLADGRDSLLTPNIIKEQVKPQQLEHQLAELRQYERLLGELECLSVSYIWSGLKKLNWQPELGQTYQEEKIAAQGGVVDFYRPLLSRCLAILAEEGIVTHQKDGWLLEKEPSTTSIQLEIQRLECEFPNYLAEINLIERCGSALAAVMRRQIEPLELLFPQGNLNAIASVYSDAAGAKLMNELVAETIRCAVAIPTNRQLRILEIGGGTGATTSAILPHLPKEQIEYVFTDISSRFLTRAKENFSYPFIRYETLDIENNPFAQGFLPGSFDIIIAANVLHATTDIDKTLQHVRSLSAPNALLILLESTGARRWIDLTFGLTEGWWLCTNDPLRAGYPLVDTKHWQDLLASHGFTETNVIEPTNAETRNLLRQSVIVAKANDYSKSVSHELIFADTKGIAHSLITPLQQRGVACSVILPQGVTTQEGETAIDPDNADDYLLLLQKLLTPETREIVYFWALQEIEGEIYQAVEIHCKRFLFLLQALLQQENPPALILVTQGSVPANGVETLTSPEQSSLLGIALSLVLEHPELNFRAIDLEPNGQDLGEKLFRELYSPTRENRVALRGEQRFCPRLVEQKLEDGNINFRQDGFYLISGGTGGLGLATARWMIERGARHLVLCSRSGANAVTPEIIASLQSANADIEIKDVDVTDAQKLHTLLEECRSQYPLRGIFHIAGTLDDTTLLRLTPERFNHVLAPKVKGTWLLHQLTLNDPLDFFVCYTSAVSLIGSAGQANAAAANAFQDAFTYFRHARNLPATVINWGPWSEIGAAVDRNVLDRLAAKGFNAMAPDLALNTLEKILFNQIVRVGAIAIDWQRFPYINQSFYQHFLPQVETKPQTSSDILEQWQTTPVKQRRDLLIRHISLLLSTVLGLSTDEVSPQQGFFDLGMDSLTSTELRNLLQTDFNSSLPTTITFRFPTVETLADYLLREVLDPVQTPVPEQLEQQIQEVPPPEIDGQSSAKPQLEDPIVIVGMACRFPGGANDLESFWQLLEQGKDAVGEIPSDRWDIHAWYHPDPDTPGKIYCPYGAFLEQIDQFDAEFFGILPREAVAIDPQQRLLLETTWEALESAGQNPQQLRNSQTGVFVGAMTQDYAQLSYAPEAINAYTGSGTSISVAAGRLSYVLGLQGPSMTVDTACSSSLVAVHLACNALRNGECDIAIAGGVNLILTPVISLIESRAHMLAPDGRCKTFDASANGMVRGEGCGMIVLKRLSQALENGDRILARVYGTAVNHDGPSSGLTVPNGNAQEKLLHQALNAAKLKPEQIDFIEAHGTGTAIGDPIELESMAAVFGNRPQNRPLIIGSVKTNLGHLEGAAGIAGLIKTVLALQHHKIPPHLHFEQPNPRFDWSSHIFEVPVHGKNWHPSERQRIAGVSSFGFSGTNAHIVIGEIAPTSPSVTQQSDHKLYLLPLSARSEKSLRKLAQDYQHALNESGLADACFTASTGRAVFRHRLCILADSIATAEKALADFQSGQESDNLITQNSLETQLNVAFLFSGQGSQYSGMGQILYNKEPVFKNTLDLCNKILEPILGTSLLDLIFQLQNSELLEQTPITQPALFSLEYALAKLWQSWGIQPSALLGHSIGEYVAACLAGVFSLEDALQLVAERGRLMGELPHNGGMAAIYADFETVAAYIAGNSSQVNIAAANGSITVISGLNEIVNNLEKLFLEQGYKTKRLAVSHAFHSPLMSPILDDFARVLSKISFHEPSLTIISNVTGKPIGKEIATPDYWLRHIRSTVHFGQGFKFLIDSGYRCFVELGPKPVLLGMARLTSQIKEILWLPSILPGQDEQAQMYRSLATLFVNGASIEWTEVFKQGKRIPLPTYPFQRERYWVSNSQFSVAEIKTKLHPFISDVKKLATGEIIFEGDIGSNNPQYLEEHQVFEKTVFPATGFIEAILAASQKIFADGLAILQNVSIHQGLILSHQTTLQMIFKPKSLGNYSFEIFSSNSQQNNWNLHVTGEIKPNNQNPNSVSHWSDLEGESVSISRFYELYHQMGISYGKQFQALQELRYLGNGSQARISIDRSLSDHRYCVHPVLLDACLQSIGAAFPEIHGHELHLPYGFSSLEFFGNPGNQAWTRADIKSDTNGEISVDLDVYDLQGHLCARFTKLAARRTNPGLQRLWQKPETNWLYQIEWKKLNSIPIAANKNSWLVFVYPGTALNELITLFRKAGERVITVELGSDYECRSQDSFAIDPSQGSDFRRLCQEAWLSGFPTDVIFALEAAPVEEGAHIDNCRAALHLIQAITAHWEKLPHLWFVTRGANKVLSETSVQPQQSMLWGLGAVVNNEYPQTRCVCLDLPPTAEPNEAEFLFNEFHTSSGELRLALRGGNRYGARLVSAKVPTAQKQKIVTGGAYLITGGLGKLGLLMAQWLSSMGASHVVLCSRNVKSQHDAIASLAKNGTQITVVGADVASPTDMEQLFSRFGTELPELRGVIHAAGVLDDGLLRNQNWERYQNVMRPKVEGTLLLDRYTRNLSLDFFIAFSSAAVILGSPGQSSYAAANAFMDALMQQRQSLGLPGISINWGAWDTGNEIEKQRFASWGIQSMSDDTALEYLSQLIQGNSQGVIIDIDWQTFHSSFNINQPFFAEVLTPKAKSQDNSAKLLERLKSVTVDERSATLAQGIEQVLREVTGLNATSVIPHQTSFLELGLNSLMVLEFKNRLENNLACSLPASIIFDYPNITSLSTYIQSEILAEQIEFEAIAPEDTLNPYDNFSEDELTTLLNQKLAELDKYGE